MPDDNARMFDEELFVRLPHPIMSAVEGHKISHGAGYLYGVMLSCRNERRGDNEVWPSREWMAAKMGLTQPRAVDKYLTELESANLILKSKRRTSGGMRARNTYTLLVIPRSAQNRTTPRPAEIQESPGGPVVLSSALRSAQKRTSVVRSSAPRRVRKSAQELDEVELDQEEPNESSSSTRLDRAIADVRTRLGLDDDDDALRIIENRKSKNRDPVSFIDLFIAAIPVEDLTEAKDEVRAEKQPATTVGLAEGYATHDQKLTLGRCEHGNAGGNYRNPTGDLYWCPQCRRDERDGIEVPIPAAIVALYDTVVPARAARGGYRAYTELRRPDGTRDASGQRAPL